MNCLYAFIVDNYRFIDDAIHLFITINIAMVSLEPCVINDADHVGKLLCSAVCSWTVCVCEWEIHITLAVSWTSPNQISVAHNIWFSDFIWQFSESCYACMYGPLRPQGSLRSAAAKIIRIIVRLTKHNGQEGRWYIFIVGIVRLFYTNAATSLWPLSR